MKRVVIISDTQLPYEDRRALNNVIKFIGDYQPDQVIQIGDLMDYPTPSRWNKGTREEFAQLVREHSDYGKRKFLEPLRAVYDGPIGILEGNHDLRPRTYLSQYAPALAEFEDVLRFEVLLDFDGFGVEKVPALTPVGPDTLLMHGHEKKGSSRLPAGLAFLHAEALDANVVCGHTHKLGVRRHTRGYVGGKITTRWGFEVGCLMDRAKAQYLGETGSVNWQLGFGLLYVGDHDVSPVAIDVRRDGSFVVEGERYGALKRGPGGKFAPAA